MKKLVLLFSAAVLVLGSIAFITKSIPGSPLHIAKVVGAVQDQQIASVDDNSGDWLTYSHPDIMGAFHQIVRDGIFLPKGMPKFGGRLSDTDISNIKGYILATAKKNREKKQ